MYKTPQKCSYSGSSFISTKETVLKVKITCSPSPTGLVAPPGLPALPPCSRFWLRFGTEWFPAVPLSWRMVGSLGRGGGFRRSLTLPALPAAPRGPPRALVALGAPAASLLTLRGAEWAFLDAPRSVHSPACLSGRASRCSFSLGPVGAGVGAYPACSSAGTIFPEAGTLALRWAPEALGQGP